MRAAAFNDLESQAPPSPEMLERIVPAAEDAGFEYIPIAAVQAICRWTSSLNAPSTAISSSNEPLCSTFPARIT